MRSISIITGLFILIHLFPVTVSSQNVDTVHTLTKTRVYQGPQTVKQRFLLPDDSKDYEKISMIYTISCPPEYGCDPWDVINSLYVRPKGDGDSWQNERWEIARFITPYGGTFGSEGGPCIYNCTDNHWSHTWEIDVTPYMSLLRDSVEFQINGASYHDWCCAGFEYTVTFLYQEGELDYIPYKVENLWQGQPRYYGAPNYPSEDFLTPEGVLVDPAADSARLRIITTGHSFGDGVYNAAEFYCTKHRVKVQSDNKDTTFIQDFWRNDCEFNPIGVQAGTYYWNRAGWCPGDYVYPNEWDITDYLASTTGKIVIDYDFAKHDYTPITGPSSHPQTGGSQIMDCEETNDIYSFPGGANPNYKIEAQIFYYKKKCDAASAPALPVITASGETLIASPVEGDIRWYMDGQWLPQITGNTYTPLKSATYTVAVTNASGCTTVSEPLAYYFVGIGEIPAIFNVNVYPNPADEQLNIRFTSMEPQDVVITLQDITGKTLLQTKQLNFSGYYYGNLDLSTLANGVYMLKIQSGKAMIQEKIIHQ